MSTPFAHEGVPYLPLQGPFQSSLSLLDLKHQGIRYIRIQWVDLINNIRYRIVPLPYFKKLLALSRPGISIPKVALGIAFLAVAEGFRYVSDTTNPDDHADDTYVSHSVRLEIGSLLLIYLRSGYAHMLLHMPL